jgi:predicted metalloprotease
MSGVTAPGRHSPRRAVACVALVLAALVAAGCTRTISGEAEPAPSSSEGELAAPPVQVVGGKGSPTDRLAADIVAGIEGYWRVEFPKDFGHPWPGIHGYFAVDPSAPGQPPPCLPRALDMDQEALYCPSEDTVAWDRVGLLPRLARDYGPGAIVVALAHEMGHAVQNRLGIDATAQVTQRDRYPTILLEAMADCYAGSAMHAVVDGRVPKVRIDRADLDRALRALLSLRDPIGAIGTRQAAAHGDAFDRSSAFIDGYTGGPPQCAGMTVDNQVFTQRAYTSMTDELQGGNLDLPDLEHYLGADAASWFGDLVTAHGGHWTAPRVLTSAPAGCPTPGAGGQGPVAFCPADRSLRISSAKLGVEHDSIGDYASGALLVSRYALAALSAEGRPVHGPDTSHALLCLTGSYTRALLDRNGMFQLSPGDIDEAVDELIDHDYAARDMAGTAAPGDMGFERIEQFRTGVLSGPAGCGL